VDVNATATDSDGRGEDRLCGGRVTASDIAERQELASHFGADGVAYD
jgi:hypothetical protein